MCVVPAAPRTPRQQACSEPFRRKPTQRQSVLPPSMPAGECDVLLEEPDPSPSLAPDARFALRLANTDSGSQY